MSTPKMTLHTWALIVVLATIWGSSFLFARIAVLEVPPLTLVFLRVALAALVLNLFLALRSNGFAHTRSVWRDFAIMGVINNIIPFGLIFYGQLEIGAGLAAIINAMTPIWTVVIANFGTSDEKFSTNKIIGVVLGFIGVAILIGASLQDGWQGSTIGQLAVFGATISYGFAGVFGRRFSSVPPVETARGQLTMSSVLIAPLVLAFDQPWQLTMPSQTTVWCIVLLAVLCTALAYLLFFQILAKAGAVNVSLVTFLVPPSAIILGIMVLDERLELHHMIGMGIIMAGLIVIDGRLLKR
ncbi:MAG: DMT family transporter [Rhizobiaceae bacterium]